MTCCSGSSCACSASPASGCSTCSSPTASSHADQGWLEVHRELRGLHIEKASGYGNDEDRLANYTLTSEAVGEPAEFTCWLRIHEKCVRALNLIRAGKADEVLEGPDVAALAIAAETLRRRRF